MSFCGDPTESDCQVQQKLQISSAMTIQVFETLHIGRCVVCARDGNGEGGSRVWEYVRVICSVYIRKRETDFMISCRSASEVGRQSVWKPTNNFILVLVKFSRMLIGSALVLNLNRLASSYPSLTQRKRAMLISSSKSLIGMPNVRTGAHNYGFELDTGRGG